MAATPAGFSTALPVARRLAEACRASALAPTGPRRLGLTKRPGLQFVSVFTELPAELRGECLALLDAAGGLPTAVDRAVGSLVGLVVADSLGHNFEFLPARDSAPALSSAVPSSSSSSAASWLAWFVGWSGGSGTSASGLWREGCAPLFEYPSEDVAGGKFHNPFNRFQLRRGQWTDDSSMALCLADSLLTCGSYDGSSVRVWFWNWLHNGLNNGFRHDAERTDGGTCASSLSVGLGGNIAKSLSELDRIMQEQHPPFHVPPRFTARGEDAGNGSLMRLAPVPLRYHNDIATARRVARESSLTTHPGPLAAEACAFLAHAIVRAVHRGGDDDDHDEEEEERGGARGFLDELAREYEEEVLRERAASSEATPEGLRAVEAVRRLLRCEGCGEWSTERCWHWRDPCPGIERTLANRGTEYNGYPVSAGYFGSFSLDGLAVALHCMYHTSTFNEAVARCVNLCGDADTTGAICAQLAGAFYGVGAMDPAWRTMIREWDGGGEVEMRALGLFAQGSVEEGGAECDSG